MEKMKKLLILAILTLMMVGVASATLVDSEDFESYAENDTGAVFFAKTSDWNCSNSAVYPNCVDTGVVGGTGYGGWSIKSDPDDNLYLNMYALNGTSAGGCKRTTLTWDFIDTSTGSTTTKDDYNYTLKYSLRVNNFDINQGSFGGTSLRYVYGQFIWAGGSCGLSDCYNSQYIGRPELLIPTTNEWIGRYRAKTDYSTGGYMDGGSINLNDGLWHDIDIHFVSNGSQFVNHTVYVDGSLAFYNESITSSYWGYIPFYNLVIGTQCQVDMDIDNIEVYQDELTTPSFTLPQLVDYEDFEGFASGQNITGQSSEWDCYGTTGDGCVGDYGTPVTPYYAGHEVVSEVGNKYLNVYNIGAFNPSVSGGAYTMLYWNHTDSEVLGFYENVNYTTNFKLRLSVYDDDAVNFSNNWRAWAGLGEWWGAQNNYYIGSDGDCGEGDCQLRLAYWTYGSIYPPYTTSQDFRPQPASTNCSVPEDGQWHQYSVVTFMNYTDSVHIRYIWMYMDGDLCYEQYLSTADQYFGNTPYYDYMIFSVGNAYALDYDDIELWVGTVIEDSIFQAQCEDGIDNDGDGYTDYPNDPSCSSSSDNTEAPYDVPQCADGIDNDLDGFVDLDDPSCSSSLDNTESPADASSQEEDECLQGLGCLIYDTVPYSDSPFLHGWNPVQPSETSITGYLGGFSINLDTVDDDLLIKENVIISKNISHTNNYNTLEGQFAISFRTIEPFNTVVDEAVILSFVDYNNNSMATVLLNVTADPSETSSADYEVDIYAYDYDHYEYVSTAYVDDVDNGFMRIYFFLDEQLNTFTLDYQDSLGVFSDTATYQYDSTSFGQVHKAYVVNTIGSDEVEVLLNLVQLYSADESDYDSVCDTFELPYHLKESFNGYASDCDWNVDPDLWNWGYVNIINDYDSYMLYKIFHYDDEDAIYYDRSRYATVEFDLKIYSDSTTVNAMSLFLYDLAFQTAWGRFYYKSNGVIDTTEGGDLKTITYSMPTDVYVPHKIVIDLVGDTYDYYVNGTKVADGYDFHNEFYNLEYFNGIYFQSADSHWALDNLAVYESDADGDEQINSVENPIDIVDEDRSFCGLFYEVEMPCNEDSDCPTDECLPNGKCSSFDFTYCDENAHRRGSMCMISGMTSCVLESTGDLILDNFFLFLVFLIIIMGLVYLTIMFRR